MMQPGDGFPEGVGCDEGDGHNRGIREDINSCDVLTLNTNSLTYMCIFQIFIALYVHNLVCFRRGYYILMFALAVKYFFKEKSYC